ncbi:Soluble lytic murein transglycosylase-like protein [Neorhizobium galegae bv. officinalis]|jgi:soluble lytic murein transglycosylase-like protein|uniref:Soluble lytic murein transglycosylase-like protein n=1 Tax=Neorhizobium galegae bv. officinalis TaxID=323656 RepID=A0A0T7FP32_NEOGA|nr:Soluble lytic murein transglycosylase-like protein [Neorhizobium galegae bv. officinalis]
MAIIRFLGRGTAVACAVSSVLAGCSSVEREQKLAATQTVAPTSGQATGPVQTASADGQTTIQYKSDLPVNGQAQTAGQITPPGVQVASAAQTVGTQPTVALAKSARLPVPVPATADAMSVQSAAMASPTMAPLVAFAPAPGPAMMPPPVAPTTSTILASAQPANLAAPKGGRLVSPPIAPAVSEGKIQPAAASAIALDERELTPDMVALQTVVPTPRPDTATLAYAAQPRAVAALSAVEFPPAPGEPMPSTATGAPPELSKLIKRYAGMYGVPESLVHRVVHRESKYDPKAYHKNGYWGLMQIKYSTAKSMGYEGPPAGLLDAETNLKYAIKYLRGAWLVADNRNDNAIKLYARGYYYDAKRKNMLDVLEK